MPVAAADAPSPASALDDLLCGLGVDPAAEAQLLLDALHRRPPEPGADREYDQERDDHRQRDERRRRAEGVEIGSEGGGLDQADDLERQRQVAHNEQRRAI